METMAEEAGDGLVEADKDDDDVPGIPNTLKERHKKRRLLDEDGRLRCEGEDFDQPAGNDGSRAGGSSQALITTFAGLTVGIPALVANRYLLARVDRLVLELEGSSLTVLEQLLEQRGNEQ